MPLLSYPIRQRKGGADLVDAIISFLVAVTAGVAVHGTEDLPCTCSLPLYRQMVRQ